MRKVIVAITGASGAIYALELPDRLRGLPEEAPADRAHTSDKAEQGIHHSGQRMTVEQQKL